MKQLFAPQTLL